MQFRVLYPAAFWDTCGQQHEGQIFKNCIRWLGSHESIFCGVCLRAATETPPKASPQRPVICEARRRLLILFCPLLRVVFPQKHVAEALWSKREESADKFGEHWLERLDSLSF